LVDAQIPDRTIAWATAPCVSPWAFLAALNVFPAAGRLRDGHFFRHRGGGAIMVPVALAFGVDPVHLGIIFLANMELGYLTPLVGMNIFFASYRFGKPVIEVCRAVCRSWVGCCSACWSSPMYPGSPTCCAELDEAELGPPGRGRCSPGQSRALQVNCGNPRLPVRLSRPPRRREAALDLSEDCSGMNLRDGRGILTRSQRNRDSEIRYLGSPER